MVYTTGPGTGSGPEARSRQLVGDRYRLLTKLGEGGFGEVWRAKDQSLDIDVAVKQVRLPLNAPQSQRAAQTERALREARHAAKLRDHPNVVAVHDVVDDGGPWIVMQLVEGRTLANRVKDDGPLSETEAVYLAMSLLQALRAAQAVKVVHRDIKPANVMLTDDGEVLLTDFGIAVHDADPSITASGVILGSAEYMAPERARGQEATYASDLFSLGVTLYHAVEGVSPFHRDTPTGSLTAVLLDDPSEPQRAGVLKPLLGALLQKEPAKRPGLADALTTAQNAAEQLGPTTSTRAYTRPFQRTDPKQRNAKVAPALALLAKAIGKVATAAILRSEDWIQTARDHRRARAANKDPKKPETQTTVKRRSPWQAKATFLLMLGLLGLALYALKHAEIPTAWHPVIADQDARVAAQNLIDKTRDAYSPGWWVCAPTGLVVLVTATLWTTAGVNAIPNAAGGTVRVLGGLISFAAGAGAAFCAVAGGAVIFHTWLPPIGALWASAGTLTGVLTIAVGWTAEADKKNSANKTTAKGAS
ncbi:serine/threonine protein kinase [Catenulispora sp. NF23]|uniref:serine/threonine-protein kinase n=1 Tax=Catenulispora pinistramenti TaxID=2705254 RepID=UPI001BAB77E2|nr:serine/threonine-protein kinase [Catenulispora pinistramenti]MBS2533407.1 serine/threonine protein kinase [Catenulispora pinistramenti]